MKFKAVTSLNNIHSYNFGGTKLKTFYDCIPCFIKQTLEVSRRSLPGEVEIHGKIINQVLQEVTNLNMSTPPPVVAQRCHKIIRDMTGNSDPYKQLKDKFNLKALQLYPTIKKIISESPTPFDTAVKLAIAGNVIDFGINSTSENMDLESIMYEVLQQTPFIDHSKQLEAEIKKASKILYLADNTGEIVFDKAFIEYLMPKKIILAVRESPVINDATYEDAKTVGLTDIVKVIHNGNDAPGTHLEECCSDFLQEFESADLIISKGQGNYETLSDVDKNIFFLLRAKCDCVSKHVGCKLHDTLIIGTKYA